MRRTALLVIGLTAVALLACGPLGTATPTSPPASDKPLVAVWAEARRIGADGASFEPDDPLYIGFFPNGTFKAVYESRTFETHHDFWSEWDTDGDTLTLRVAGGNDLPQQSEYRGRFEVRRGELTLGGIALVDDFAGPTTVFSYHGPAPESKVVP